MKRLSRSRIWRAAVSAACGLCGFAVAPSTGLAAGAAARQPAPLLRLQQAYVQCPVAGSDARSMLIDGPAQWRAAVRDSEHEALGRAVRWRDERVLVVAMARQPTLGITPSLSSRDTPSKKAPRLRLEVERPGEGELVPTVLSRPCVVAVLGRGAWRAVWVDAEDGASQVVLPRR